MLARQRALLKNANFLVLRQGPVSIFSLLGFERDGRLLDSESKENSYKVWRSFIDEEWRRRDQVRHVYVEAPPDFMDTMIFEELKDIIHSKKLPPIQKRAMERGILKNVKQIAPQGVARIYAISASNSYKNPALFEALADHVLQSRPPMIFEFNPLALTKAIQALGKLYYGKDGSGACRFPSLRKLADTLVRECRSRQRTGALGMEERQLTYIIHGLGLLYSDMRDESMERVEIEKLFSFCMEIIVEHEALIALTPNSLCDVLQGCQLFGYREEQKLATICNQIAYLMVDHNRGFRYHTLPVEEKFNPGNVSRLVLVMGRLRFMTEKLGIVFGNEIAKQLEKFGPRELVMLIEGLSNLKFKEMGSLDDLGKQLLDPVKLSECTDKDLANVLHAFGKMKYKNRNVIDVLAKEVVDEFRLENFSDDDLAQVVYGLAVSTYGNDTVMGDLMSRITEPSRLSALSNEGLSRLVYAFSETKVDTRDKAKLLGKEVMSKDRLPDLTETELASILEGFARLQCMDAELIDALSQEASKPARLKAAREDVLARNLLVLAQLECKNMDSIRRLVLEALRPQRLINMSTKDMSSIIYALGLIGIDDKSLLIPFLEEICIPMNLKNIRLREVARTVYGIGRLAGKLDETFQREHLLEFVNPLVRESRILVDRVLVYEDISLLAHGLVNLRFYDKDLMMQLADITLDMYPGYDPKSKEDGMFTMLKAFALFKLTFRPLLKFGEEWVELNGSQLQTVEQVTDLMGNFAVLDWLAPTTFAVLNERLHQLSPKLDMIDANGWANVGRALTYLQADLPNDDSMVLLRNRAKEECLAKRTFPYSKLEHEVVHVAKDMPGVGLELDCPVEERYTRVDVVVNKGGRKFRLFIDGSDSYSINKVDGELISLGHIKFRDENLQSNDYEVIRVPFYKWGSMDRASRVEWMKSSMAASIKKKPTPPIKPISIREQWDL